MLDIHLSFVRFSGDFRSFGLCVRVLKLKLRHFEFKSILLGHQQQATYTIIIRFIFVFCLYKRIYNNFILPKLSQIVGIFYCLIGQIKFPLFTINSECNWLQLNLHIQHPVVGNFKRASAVLSSHSDNWQLNCDTMTTE